MLELSGVQVGAGPRQRVDDTVLGAAEPALAVDHHRRRQHQPPAARREHLGEQHRRPVVVVAAVRRRIRGVHPGPHDRRLMTHHVDSVEQRRDGDGVADVDALHTLGRLGVSAVRGGQHRVEGDNLVTRVAESRRHPRSDEAGCTGQQHSHGRSIGRTTPSCGRQSSAQPLLGHLVDRLVHQLLERAPGCVRTRRTRRPRAHRRRRRCRHPHRSPKRLPHSTSPVLAPAPPRGSRSC